ncbi:hypothetical protein ACVWXO_001822 [Bradyrhizobium sp. LM2.7]
MKKNAIVAVVALLGTAIAVSVVYLQFGIAWTRRTDGSQPFPPTLIPIQNEPTTYSWQFKNGPYNDAAHSPTVSVTLTLDGRRYDVGTYEGSCFEIGNSEHPLRFDERVAVRCGSADHGDEIAVLVESGKLMVGHAHLGKSYGTAPDFRGDFTPLFEL